MTPEGYMLILMACLPVILGQLPTSSPAASLIPLYDAERRACKIVGNPKGECEELFENVGANYQNAAIGNFKAIKDHLSQLVININKTLPNLAGDKKASTILSECRRKYSRTISEIEMQFEDIKTKGFHKWEPSFIKLGYEEKDDWCFTQHPNSEVLRKMYRFNDDLAEVLYPTPEIDPEPVPSYVPSDMQRL